MCDKESSNFDFTKQKQPTELQSPSGNTNKIMDLAKTQLEINSLVAQLQQQQSSDSSQTGTKNRNNRDFRKKADKGN